MYNLIIKLKCALYGYTNHIFVLVVTILDVSTRTISCFGPSGSAVKSLTSSTVNLMHSQLGKLFYKFTNVQATRSSACLKNLRHQSSFVCVYVRCHCCCDLQFAVMHKNTHQPQFTLTFSLYADERKMMGIFFFWGLWEKKRLVYLWIFSWMFYAFLSAEFRGIRAAKL